MSLSQMQIAAAELIRLPEHNRGPDFPKFVAQFELTPHEKQEIQAMAKDPQVIKYGRTMAEVRWETIKKQNPFSRKYWNEDTARYVWRNLFEPTAAHVRFRALGAGYLNYIMKSKKAQDIFLQDGPPFIIDLLRFECAQANVRLESARPQKKPTQGSRLKHMAFSIDEYQYKVSDFVLDLTQPNRRTHDEEPSPEPGQETLLVLPKTGSSDCRFFVVNEEVGDFIEHEAQSPSDTIPSFFGDLRALDLIA